MASNPQPSSSVPARSAVGKQVAVAVVVVVTVSLLTLLFSFLGTITSGALLGMMFGAIKQAKWQVCFISLVLPLVTLGFSPLFGFERSVTLAPLCFAVFWATYLVTRAALYLENQQSTQPGNVPAGNRAPGSELVYDPRLAELQGRWDRRSVVTGDTVCAESIEINRDRVRVRFSRSNGEPESVCSGRVQVEQLGPFRIATVLDGVSDGRVPGWFTGGTWLYKSAGDRLTIAWNFDHTSGKQDPRVDDYCKAGNPGD